MPMSKESATKKLNEYAFKTTWNEMSAEYAVNIKLNPVVNRPQTKSVLIGQTRVDLPEVSGGFMVFDTPEMMFFGGLDSVPSNTWVDAVDVCHKYKVLLSVYQRPGKLIPRTSFFIFRMKKGRVLVATKWSMWKNILEYSNLATTYITAYRDSDQPNDVTIRNWEAKGSNPIASIVGLQSHVLQCFALNKNGTTILVNGCEIENVWPFPVIDGDLIEVILDLNVVGMFRVNVSDNTTGYFSPLYSGWRHILHCPKAVNPNNKLVTYNTIGLSIKGVNSGLIRHMHKTDAVSVRQITHNDISLNANTVIPFGDYVEDDNLEVIVRVKTHSKDNVLLFDRSYIRYLYLCDDADIVKHLRGELDPTLPFWKAEYLEGTGYIQMMRDAPIETTPEVLGFHVEALGYYTVASFLGEHIAEEEGRGTAQSYVVRKPLVLHGDETIPKMYVNGRKVRESLTGYGDISLGTMFVSAPSIYIPSDANIRLDVHEEGPNTGHHFSPSAGNSTVTVPWQGVLIYEVFDLPSPIEGWRHQSNRTYKRINPAPGMLVVWENENGSSDVGFGLSMYGRNFIMRHKRWGWHDEVNLSSMINNDRSAITHPLLALEGGEVLPVIDWGSMEVWLNGFTLIEGIDYSVIPVRDENGNIAFTEVVISNMQYLNDTSNYLEITASSEVTVSKEVGYTVGGKLSYNNEVTLWRDDACTASLKGVVQTDVVDNGFWLTTPETPENGTPYQLVMSYSSNTQEILEGFTPQVDRNRMAAINTYFRRTVDVDPDYIIVPEKYKVYSPWLAAITRDVIEGALIVADDPNDLMFLAQFEAYDFLKERDVTINRDANVLDTRFVDIYPSYYTWSTGIFLRRVLMRLVRLVVNNPVSIGVVEDA